MNDQAQRLRELARQKQVENTASERVVNAVPTELIKCRSIAVTSGKGGVGKTNIALFLAVTLSTARKRVLLMDADLGLANVHILLGMAPANNISHFIDGDCRLEEVICRGPGGFDILPGASGLEKLANIDIGRLELLQKEFSKLEKDYDYLLIDTGAGIGASVTQFASRADTVLLVMTPEPTSLADAYAMVKVLYEKGTRKIAVLVNMATSEKEGTETFDRLNALVVKFLKKPLEMVGTLPVSRDLSRSVRRQQVLILEKGQEQMAARVQAIIRKLSGLTFTGRQSFFSRFLGR
ncbi:MAG: MinD/ParA family protein [Fibrobacter sp.]|nr:MinD/ParA family protein [Fibrobacter sp.]